MNGKAIKTRKAFRLEYSIGVHIKASPEKIWQLLTDAENYPKWSSTFTKITGDMSLGGSIKIKVPEVTNKVFNAQVKEFVPNKWMLWTNGTPSLLVGKRSHQLTSQKDGSTFFELRECFTGLMVPVFARKLPNLIPIFECFANELKGACEKKRIHERPL